MTSKLALLGTLVAFQLGAALGTLAHLFGQFVFNDWNFVASLMVLVAVDTGTGIWSSLALREHNSRKLRQLFAKLVQFSAALIVTHVLNSYKVSGETSTLFSLVAPAFRGGVYLTLLWSEVISTEENLNKLGKGFLPTWIRTRMASWMESGELPKADKATKPAADAASDSTSTAA